MPVLHAVADVALTKVAHDGDDLLKAAGVLI